MSELQAGHHNEIRDVVDCLAGIVTRPDFGLGYRSILVPSSQGNLLWDPVSLVDDVTIRRIHELGGVAAIAASHPHFFGSMVEWSLALGGVPVLVCEADRAWVQRKDDVISYWSGVHEPLAGLKLIQCGGHFPGSSVLHLAAGAEGNGTLLVGDTMQVVRDRRFVTLMWSYANQIPLSEKELGDVTAALEPYQYERVLGATWGNEIMSDGKVSVQRSAERYSRRLTAKLP